MTGLGWPCYLHGQADSSSWKDGKWSYLSRPPFVTSSRQVQRALSAASYENPFRYVQVFYKLG
ncbi:hypothetical protein M404DRAFT_991411 [Pisolithus tinctorius Marx 270]|uniref:Uncharacterized protein n=1 Tax=Pisolithus tinctorius Marx 270 TaxID=870435 RepID=A0A0C3PKA7_PISTI|nr:hypothetical protein M404DRAFT_991411 [Pisolithus tinctorius Marx 270]